MIDVIDVATWKRIETVTTEHGAHTIALDESTNRIFPFLPQTHRAAVLQQCGVSQSFDPSRDDVRA